MVTTTYAFQVRGIPATQGSKRAFVLKGTGRAVITEAGGQHHRDWRTRVAAAAQDAADGRELLAGPVFVNLHFRLPKPASAPKRKRTWPISARSGDIDKLCRCVLDALTGVLFNDDSQVVTLTASKDYGDPGAAIAVFEPMSARTCATRW